MEKRKFQVRVLPNLKLIFFAKVCLVVKDVDNNWEKQIVNSGSASQGFIQ